MKAIAVLYQAKVPPFKDGALKPMKIGGYSDSGADISYELKKNGIKVVTPIEHPNIEKNKDWVFPDTKKGIQEAIKKGANTFWLNTILYKNHVVEDFFHLDINFVGQMPSQVDNYDDKFYTNQFLREHQLPIPKAQIVSFDNLNNYQLDIDFPFVVKPIRGRGSQGVFLVENRPELDERLQTFYSNKTFGDSVYIEEYLSGQEITITVFPAGIYTIKNQSIQYSKPWSLPAVKRFNHKNGIAPYSGIVAVIENSSVLTNSELRSTKILEINRQCEAAAQLLNIKAPIRIDCRSDNNDNYYLFDINMKPNMTGPSRPERKNQDSLTLLASKKIGWSYFDLLKNILSQSWKPNAFDLDSAS